ncbi:AAA family ATPase [Phenylobacterium terrae]|uniref:AAA family ATPase n=1 Tax=Phenylobacterium terrae TaxID=2665495 RepID=A0ABW4N3E1_9CAUL
MEPGIVIVSGPPAAGKSTLARALAESVETPLSAHMHSDDVYGYIVKGFVEPWLPASQHQNTVVIEALAASAVRFVRGGYLVVMDGVIGPWFLGPWRAAAADVPVDYAILFPSPAANLARFAARTDHPLQEEAVVPQMWAAFDAHRAGYERHILDTSGQTEAESLEALRAGLAEGRFRLA